MYKLQVNPITKEVCSIWRQDKLMCIPIDPDNTDYQQYLIWIEQGNEPLPAENT